MTDAIESSQCSCGKLRINPALRSTISNFTLLWQNRPHNCRMAINKKIPKNIDEYVGRFPEEVQQLLKKMRLTIKRAAPKAKETISYGIPTFTLDGNLVWFAAHKSHIGFYPRASAIAAFKKELSAYKVAKGSVHRLRILAIPQKSGKVEYVIDSQRPEEDLPCSHSLFPEPGGQPCWYVVPHATDPIPM